MSTRFLLCALILSIALAQLSGCLAVVATGAATGASAAHDRRSARAYIDDKRLYLSVRNAINADKNIVPKNRVAIVVYNGTILLAGEVRSQDLKQRAEQLASGFEGTRRIVNELEVREPEGFWSRRRDNTITAHVKTALLDITSIAGFDPTRINVSTLHRTVYLMGKVTHEEDDAAVEIARNVSGVERVVKVFEYTDAAPEGAGGG
jgi:osmotically-inducible protein OsmY